MKVLKPFSLLPVLFLSFFCLGAFAWAEPPSTSPRKPPIHFGIQTAHQVASVEDLIKLWQEAEAWGYDSMWLNDHFLQYGKEDGPAYDAWTLLAALAEKTSRVRLGVLVTSNTFRNPAVLAKMATTVDHLSHGRLDLGIGGGWFQREHEAYGIPFYSNKERIERLEEALRVIRALWTQDEANFRGRYYQLVNAPFMPKPLQKPYPPITIGGQGEKWTLPLVARYADKWSMPAGFTPEKMAAKVKQLEKACAKVKRDCSGMDKSYQTFLVLSDDPAKVDQAVQMLTRYYTNMSADEARRTILAGTSSEEVKKQVQAFVDAGITHFIVTVRSQPYDREGLRRFAQEVMPAFR
ncbi:MAG: TIGR03560 family F420-dependent LLM class oxidoreductase [Deltaproteobacteria bacterium]|nr:TIGR03560 family F420-dependent LLM class oxidoreductase [Deltaproteobacteria bacterium]